MATAPKPPAETTLKASKEYIGFWRRFLAYWVDWFILVIAMLALSFTFSFGKGFGSYGSNFGWLIGAAYFIGLWIVMEGQTPGKKLLAIKIVRQNGQKMDFVTALLRYIGYIASGIIFGLGFIWIAFDSKKEGWHDKIAKTNVVPTGEKPKTGIAIAIVIVGFLGFFFMIAAAVVAFIGLMMMSDGKMQEAMMEGIKQEMAEEYTDEEIEEMMMEAEEGMEEAMLDSSMSESEAEEQVEEMMDELEKFGFEIPEE